MILPGSLVFLPALSYTLHLAASNCANVGKVDQQHKKKKNAMTDSLQLFDKLFKIVVVGDSGVGKSNMCVLFFSNLNILFLAFCGLRKTNF